ncbi:Nn.00g050290.m01.CDS01 [Neocucurbitaria sp. VM-36]
MPVSTNRTMLLSDNTALTKRSRKFYDGTYKWDAEGFVDDNGVYRGFDCYDPASRAPTPLPPWFPGDSEDDSTKQTTTIQRNERRLTAHLNPVLNGPTLPRYDKRMAESTMAQSEAMTNGVGDGQSVTMPRTFTLSSCSSSKDGPVPVCQDELFCGHTNREQLISKMEGILIACRHTGIELSREECHRLCGITDSTKGVKETYNREAVLPGSPGEEQIAAHESNEQKCSRATIHVLDADKDTVFELRESAKRQSPRHGDEGSKRDSDFSDCPSDLSDWDVEGQVNGGKAAPTAASTRCNEQNRFDGDAKPTRKTTRGVAQKMRKGANKRSQARPNNTTPALLSLQSGSFMRASPSSASARRRSSRQGNVCGPK